MNSTKQMTTVTRGSGCPVALNALKSSKDREIRRARKMRVLLVFCSPKIPGGGAGLRLQSEERAIRKVFARAPLRDKFELDVLPSATIDDLSEALLAKDYDIVHFSGHADILLHVRQHIVQRFRNNYGPMADEVLRSADSTTRDAIGHAALHVTRGLEKSVSEKAVGVGGTIRKVSDLKKGENVCENVCATCAAKTQTEDIVIKNNFLALKSAVENVVEVDTDSDGLNEALNISLNFSDLISHGAGSIAFEDNDGKPHFVNAKAFADLLSAYAPPVSVVILNACGSSIAGSIISEYLPFTICTSGNLKDKDAVTWSTGFYSALGAGHSVEHAYSEGSRRIALHEPVKQYPNTRNVSVNSESSHHQSNQSISQSQRSHSNPNPNQSNPNQSHSTSSFSKDESSSSNMTGATESKGSRREVNIHTKTTTDRRSRTHNPNPRVNPSFVGNFVGNSGDSSSTLLLRNEKLVAKRRENGIFLGVQEEVKYLREQNGQMKNVLQAGLKHFAKQHEEIKSLRKACYIRNATELVQNHMNKKIKNVEDENDKVCSELSMYVSSI